MAHITDMSRNSAVIYVAAGFSICDKHNPPPGSVKGNTVYMLEPGLYNVIWTGATQQISFKGQCSSGTVDYAIVGITHVGINLRLEGCVYQFAADCLVTRLPGTKQAVMSDTNILLRNKIIDDPGPVMGPAIDDVVAASTHS